MWFLLPLAHLHETGSLVLRPSHFPVFDCLQYAKTEEVALESFYLTHVVKSSIMYDIHNNVSTQQTCTAQYLRYVRSSFWQLSVWLNINISMCGCLTVSEPHLPANNCAQMTYKEETLAGGLATLE